jgi:glycosyltransferase involved in cell wall biosynthesis
MCDAYEAQYPDIVKVVHQENKGYCTTINEGMDLAEGKWVCFVDSDDWVGLDMVEIMLKYAENDNADIHIWGYYYEYVNTSHKYSYEEGTLSENAKRNCSYQQEVPFRPAVWGKLYRRSFLNQNSLRFQTEPKGFHNGDAAFSLYAMHLANKVQLHPEIFYHYRIRGSNLTNKFNPSTYQYSYVLYYQFEKFIDSYFTGKENILMKQFEAAKLISSLAAYYNHPGSGFTRKASVRRMKVDIKKEPMRSTIREVPFDIIPAMNNRVKIILIRMGLVGLWFRLIPLRDRIRRKLTNDTPFE